MSFGVECFLTEVEIKYNYVFNISFDLIWLKLTLDFQLIWLAVNLIIWRIFVFVSRIDAGGGGYLLVKLKPINITGIC